MFFKCRCTKPVIIQAGHFSTLRNEDERPVPCKGSTAIWPLRYGFSHISRFSPAALWFQGKVLLQERSARRAQGQKSRGALTRNCPEALLLPRPLPCYCHQGLPTSPTAAAAGIRFTSAKFQQPEHRISWSLIVTTNFFLVDAFQYPA